MSVRIPQPLYYAAGLVMMKGISFVMLPFVARALSTAEYGTLDIWLTLLNLGSIVVGFGLIEALYKQAGEIKMSHDRLMSTTLLLQGKLSAMALFIGVPVVWLLNRMWPTLSMTDGLLLLITLTLGALFNIPLTWLRLTDGALPFFVLTSSKALLQALLTLIFLAQGLGVRGVLLSGALSALALTAALIVMQLKTLRWQPDHQLADELLNYGKPLVLSGLLLFAAAGAERWILAATLNLQVVALFALAMQFAAIIVFVCEPITLWWFPKRFQILRQANGPQLTAWIAEGISHINLWLALAMACVGPVLISALLPERYHAAIPLLPWLALGMAFKQISHVINTGCYSGEKPAGVLRINSYIAVLALLLYLSGSLLTGLNGVVAAFVLLYAVRAIAFARFSQRMHPLPYAFQSLIIHCVICTMAMSAATVSSVWPWYVLGLQTLWLGHWLLQKNQSLRFHFSAEPAGVKL